MDVGDFNNYNYFIIFNFLIMNNISVTIKMCIESWVSVVKLDVQCDHRLLLPLFLIASTIGRFLSVYPKHLILLLKTLRCFHIAYVPNCIIKQIEFRRIKRSIFLSDIIREIFIEIIGNRMFSVATSPISLNSELLSTR